MSLKDFAAQENRLNSFMGLPQIDITKLDAAGAESLFQRLDSNMSPEALYADGERPRAQAAKLAKIYKQAFKDLLALGFKPVREMYNLTA